MNQNLTTYISDVLREGFVLLNF